MQNGIKRVFFSVMSVRFTNDWTGFQLIHIEKKAFISQPSECNLTWQPIRRTSSFPVTAAVREKLAKALHKKTVVISSNFIESERVN